MNRPGTVNLKGTMDFSDVQNTSLKTLTDFANNVSYSALDKQNTMNTV